MTTDDTHVPELQIEVREQRRQQQSDAETVDEVAAGVDRGEELTTGPDVAVEDKVKDPHAQGKRRRRAQTDATKAKTSSRSLKRRRKQQQQEQRWRHEQ